MHAEDEELLWGEKWLCSGKATKKWAVTPVRWVGGGERPCHVEASPTGMPAGKGGLGEGTLCSVQKSQKATKNEHGQATFPFPSPQNLSQTIKIIISPLTLPPSRWLTGRQAHPSQGYVGPSSWLWRASREAGCLAVGLWWLPGSGRRGHGDGDLTPGRETVWGETRVVSGGKE